MRSDTDDGPEGVACSLHTVRMIKKLTWVRRNGSECKAQNLKKVALSPVQTGFLDERIYREHRKTLSQTASWAAFTTTKDPS